MKLTKSKKAQSIIEYICVAIAFTTVGVATFLAGVKGAAVARQKALHARVVNNGLDQSKKEWPSTWSKPIDDDPQSYSYAPGYRGESVGGLVGQQDKETKWVPVNVKQTNK